MKIQISQSFPINNIQSSKSRANILAKQKTDSFESSAKNNSISFGSNLFTDIKNFFTPKSQIPVENIDNEDDQPPTSYAIDLSYGIKKVMGKDVPPKNLSNIMTPDEFRKILPKLNQQNFISSRENVEDGIYAADLDYQSKFSGAKENVFDILDKVADYAQIYHKKTGKDFIFALTDRDSLEGLQHAIKIIGENPCKYKNLKLIPAVKLSFAHKAPTSVIGYENSEMLVYGINPYSENVAEFVENVIKKRKQMTLNFIKDVNNLYPEFAYKVIEFAEQNDLKYNKDYTVSNLYWRAREYATTKGDTAIKGISLVPDEIVDEANNILDNLSEVYLGSDEKGFSSLGSSIIKDSDVNKTIKKVFEKYSTHYDDNEEKVVSSAENLYDDMIECFSKEAEKPVMALASPFYFSHYFEEHNTKTYDNVVEFFDNLQQDSNGMLLAFESEVPNYSKDANLTPEIIEKFNNEIREKTNLREVGGSLMNQQY